MTTAPEPARRSARARALLWCCFPLFALGVFGPAFRVASDLGPATEWARIFGVVTEPRTLAIADTIQRLFSRGELVLGAVVLLATIVAPLAKILAIDYALRVLAASAAPRRALSVAAVLGRWAFLEVLLAALLVAASTAGKLGFRMELLWGFHVYLACALLTFVLSLNAEGALRRSRVVAGD